MSNKNTLIGLCGPAGSGKDTVANFMVQRGFDRFTLAMALKLGLRAMFDIPLSVWDDREEKEAVVPWIGKSPRQLAQTLGTEWGRSLVAEDIWVRVMLRRWEKVRASGLPYMVVTDVRFDNEALAIINAGGTVWKVQRDTIPVVSAHVSENGVSPALIRGVIENYGSLDDLRVATDTVIRLLVR